jgi:hypothetical protein
MRIVKLFVDSKSINVCSSHVQRFDDQFEYERGAYHSQLQSFLSLLVKAEILKLNEQDELARYFGQSFHVKGIQEPQRLSNEINGSYTSMTIEDLLILAANANNIEYPAVFDGGSMLKQFKSLGVPEYVAEWIPFVGTVGAVAGLMLLAPGAPKAKA